jgi:hypothetical protein
MQMRRLSLACLTLVLLGLAWTLPAGRRAAGAGPQAGEATPALILDSLRHDRDLRFEAGDLARSHRVWNGGPAGLALHSPDGGATYRFAAPLAYPLAALPAYVLFGARGLPLLNMALYLAMVAGCAWLLRGERGAAGLFLAGSFFASAALPAALRHGPEVFVMAGVLLPLLAWRRWREIESGESGPPGRAGFLALAAAGAWLAGAALTWEPAALLAIPIVVDLAARRRRRALAAFVGGALVAAVLLVALQARFCRSPFPAHAEGRRTYAADFPLGSGAGGPAAPAVNSRPVDLSGAAATTPPTPPTTRALGRRLLELLAGRHGGLLPAFPFALFAFALFAAEPRERSRTLLALALAAAFLAALLLRPEAPGPAPWFALLAPACLLLPGRLTARRSLLLPFAAAGLWTAPLILTGLGAAPPAVLHTAPFRALPLELTQLRELPGLAAQVWGEAVWVVPAEDFWTAEQHPNGVWMRGAARSEVVVVAPRPIPELRFRVWSLAADGELTVRSGDEQVTVRFDTPGKRAGAPIVLHPEPVARGLGFLPGAPQETFYRLTLQTTQGAVPASLDPKSRDLRYLGVFLDFAGNGP